MQILFQIFSYWSHFVILIVNVIGLLMYSNYVDFVVYFKLNLIKSKFIYVLCLKFYWLKAIKDGPTELINFEVNPYLFKNFNLRICI